MSQIKKRGRPKKVVETPKELSRESKPLDFEVTLLVNETEYKANGASVYEALSNLPLKEWVEVITNGSILVSHAGNTIQRDYQRRHLCRTLCNPPIREHEAMILEDMLGIERHAT